MENNQQMSDLNPTIFIKTLNINGKKKPIKMKICQPGLKKKIQLCAAYKQPTLRVKKQIKSSRMESVYLANSMKAKQISKQKVLLG